MLIDSPPICIQRNSKSDLMILRNKILFEIFLLMQQARRIDVIAPPSPPLKEAALSLFCWHLRSIALAMPRYGVS